MEQATDAEKAMSVAEFLDFKRRNKVGTTLILLSCQRSLLLMCDWLLPVSLQSFPVSFIGIYVKITHRHTVQFITKRCVLLCTDV